MSDFVNEFWNWYVILIVLISIVACAVFLWTQSLARRGGPTTDTTGHVWDETLQEYNNPLPRWWMWLFYATVVFALVYVALYPWEKTNTLLPSVAMIARECCDFSRLFGSVAL